MTKTKSPPAVLEFWRVGWWQTDRGALTLHSKDFEIPGDARVAFSLLHPSTRPTLTREAYNVRHARWESFDVIGQAVTPERAADINRRGIACMRAIVGHRRGTDTRGSIVGSLDAELADPRPPGPIRPTEPLVSDSAADCTVCDYLCEYGLTAGVDEYHVVIVDQQELTDAEPEMF
jgi:hypothetical protein